MYVLREIVGNQTINLNIKLEEETRKTITFKSKQLEDIGKA